MITIWKVYWQDQEQFALESFRPLFNFRHPVGRSFNTILGHINETSCIWYRLKCPSARARQLNACARLLEKLARSFTIKTVTKFLFDPSSIYSWSKKLPFLLHSGSKLWSETNRTKVSSDILIMKSSGNNLIFLPVFFLIMWVMKTLESKVLENFEKIFILKIWELISLGGVKSHFDKLALKWCIFSHEKNTFQLILCHCSWSN